MYKIYKQFIAYGENIHRANLHCVRCTLRPTLNTFYAVNNEGS